MDPNKFDRFTATLGVISTRRLVLGGLVAALAGALGPIAPQIARGQGGNGNGAIVGGGHRRRKGHANTSGKSTHHSSGNHKHKHKHKGNHKGHKPSPAPSPGTCTGKPAGGTCAANTECCSGACTCGPENGTCQGPFRQDFSSNAIGWIGVDQDPQDGGIGIAPKQTPNEPFTRVTRWGGYSNVFPKDGYTTTLDIFLD